MFRRNRLTPQLGLWMLLVLVINSSGKASDVDIARATYRFPGVRDVGELDERFVKSGFPYSEESGISRERWKEIVGRGVGFNVAPMFTSRELGNAPEYGSISVFGVNDTDEIRALALGSYSYYRSIHVPELRSRIQALEAEQQLATRKLEALRTDLSKGLASSRSVLLRSAAVDASTTRSEDLRSRLVNLRIRQAVLEATVRSLTERYAERVSESRAKNEKLASAGIDAILKRFTPNHPKAQEEIKKTLEKYSILEADAIADELRERIANKEVELVEVEEEVKAIVWAQEEERSWRSSLLHGGEDLVSMRSKVDSQTAIVDSHQENLESYRRQLATLEKGEPALIR